MKRPLALIGLTSMTVLAVCFYADFKISLMLFVLAAVGFGVSLAVKRLRKEVSPAAFFATVMLSVIGFNMFTAYQVLPVQNKYCRDEECEVVATLLEPYTYNDYGYYYTLRAKSVNGEEANFKLSLVSRDKISCSTGDSISVTAYLSCTDYSGNLADGCYITAYPVNYSDAEVTEAHKKTLLTCVYELRAGIKKALYKELSHENADLGSAVLLGDKSGLSSELRENIRKAGLSHIIVVSGFHLSVTTSLYYKLFGKRIKKKYINAAVIFLLVLFFLMLTGFGRSTIRAAIMVFVIVAAGLFGRESDSVNSLGLAAILLTVFNPYVVGDAGVLLSFSATFGIVAFSTPLEKFLTKGLLPIEQSWYRRTNKFLRYLARLFSTSFTAAVATIPVVVLFFGKVSLVQIITNMLVLPLVKYFMLFLVLTAVFHYLPFLSFICKIFGFLADLAGNIFRGVAKTFASLPMAYVKADYEFVIFWIFASLALLALIYLLRRKGRGLRLLCALISVMILLSGGIAKVLVYSNTATLYVVPSYSGNMVILSSADGNAVLSCSGNVKYITDVLEILENQYTDNRLMVVASEDSTAAENADEILSVFDYEKILMYDTNNELSGAREDIVLASEDCVINLYGKAVLRVIKCEDKVYQHLTFGETEVLILPYLGDAQHIPESLRGADVLITAGMAGNMELLSFETLIANGNSFQRAAVIDFYRERDAKKISVSETINFDIVG